MNHSITVYELSATRRLRWECSCGHAGTCSMAEDVEIHAEKHVRDSAPISYTFRNPS